ncbi:hypothetical protein ACFV3I_05600 [Microbacterium sp. NPDC059771]|uniref:hypothetical protein n=1 Tax=Microbacterium sp. NPDC059771 TaxID=3346941 RepID=UPI0036588076
MAVLLGSKALRALSFVETLADQGVRPTLDDVDAFVEAVTNWATYDPYWDEVRVRTVAYLQDARLLVDDDGRAALTDAGRALLHASETVGDTVEVVGRLSDPFTYASVLSRIDAVDASLVVDPYLYPADLHALLQLTSVQRILVKWAGLPRVKPNERMRQLAIMLGARPDVEMRYVHEQPTELHDRLVLSSSSSSALQLGTSLGGTQMTVLTQLSAETASLLRLHYEKIWAAATVLDPIGRASTKGELPDER